MESSLVEALSHSVMWNQFLSACFLRQCARNLRLRLLVCTNLYFDNFSSGVYISSSCHILTQNWGFDRKGPFAVLGMFYTSYCQSSLLVLIKTSFGFGSVWMIFGYIWTTMDNIWNIFSHLIKKIPYRVLTSFVKKHTLPFTGPLWRGHFMFIYCDLWKKTQAL